MARSAGLLLLASTLCGVASAASSQTPAGVIQWDIARNEGTRSAQLQARSLRRRNLQNRQSDTVTASLANALYAGLYAANITVGTPAQQLQVQIDTGSSDVWVPASSASICGNQQEGGCPGGSFDTSKSSTFNVVGRNEFNISYVDGSGSTGDYFQDTFSIGGGTIKKFEMGLATDTTIGTGIMGIGYNTSEANVDTGSGKVYANLPYAMANAGLINANAYSLWLNDLDASTGSVLFGGVDTAQYTGGLTAIDVYPTEGVYMSFTVAFTSLSATSSSGTDQLTPSNYAQPAILDSGTTITLLPNDLIQVVYEELGATVDRELGVLVPCSLGENSGTLNYGFGGPGGPVIKVGVSELVLPFTLEDGSTPTFTNGQAACQLGIQAAGDDPILLGDTFLRSAYVVYDLDNNKIALAQTKFNTTDTNIVAFESGGASIPSATNAASEADVTATATGVPKVGVSATATAAGSGSATYNPTATGLNAQSGFISSSTGTSSHKKNAGVEGPRPVSMNAILAVTFVSLAGMAVGGALL